MLWAPACFLHRGCCAQPTLTQPASESVAPGGTIKFSCTMSSGTNISGYYIYWFQQTAGNPPRYLLYYKDESSKHQGSGVPARFSASKDTSSNICYLAITRIQAEDDADYYCASQGTETKTPKASHTQLPAHFPHASRALAF
uniref:Ig-like domain-containing protein n=1 Tax=Gopherus agassizii TaxID=38772 RepID=A0A452HJ84_9SAUR